MAPSRIESALKRLLNIRFDVENREKLIARHIAAQVFAHHQPGVVESSSVTRHMGRERIREVPVGSTAAFRVDAGDFRNSPES